MLPFHCNLIPEKLYKAEVGNHRFQPHLYYLPTHRGDSNTAADQKTMKAFREETEMKRNEVRDGAKTQNLCR